MSESPPAPGSSPAPSKRRALIFAALGAVVVAAAIVIGVTLSAPGSSGHYRVTDGTITIESARVGSLGTVLVTDQG